MALVGDGLPVWASLLWEIGSGSVVGLVLFVVFCRLWPPKREDPPR